MAGRKKAPAFLDLVADLDVLKFKPGYWSTAVHQGGKIDRMEHEPMNGIHAVRRGAAPAERLGRLAPEDPQMMALRQRIERLSREKAPPNVPRHARVAWEQPYEDYDNNVEFIPDGNPHSGELDFNTAALEEWLRVYMDEEKSLVGPYPKEANERMPAEAKIDFDSAESWLSDLDKRRSAVKKYKRTRRKRKSAEKDLKKREWAR